MVTKEFARKAGWKETTTTQLLQSTNHQPVEWNMVTYHMLLVYLTSKEHKILAFKIEQKTGDIDPLFILNDITKGFGGVCDTLDISQPYR